MKRILGGAVLAAILMATSSPSRAATVTGTIDRPFQLTQSAVPGIGYLDYAFVDNGTKTIGMTTYNVVTLTVTSFLSTSLNAYVQKDGLYFNYGPNTTSAPSASTLIFQQVGTGLGDNAIANLGSAGSKNAFKADGDGHYDINFTFGASAKALKNGQSITVDILGLGLAATDFIARSADKKQNDSGDSPEPNNYAGAHFAYKSGSVWYGSNGMTIYTPPPDTEINAVPEPSTAALALIGAGSLGVMGLRRRRVARGA